MDFVEIKQNKKNYLDLLLLADEQESMIDKYIEKGTMYALKDSRVRAICVVTDEGNGVLEIKNIAVEPNWQRKGLGKLLIDYLGEIYKKDFFVIQAGTGDSPLTVPFYEKCGFKKSHTIENFFTDNYDHPIYECGVQLRHMIYFQKEIR